MRKFWVTLAALCGAAVLFCGLLAFAACDPAAEEPSQAERLQRFIDTVDEDTDKFVFAFNAKGKTEKEEYDPLTGTYKPVLDPETGEPLYEEEEVWLQFCNDGVNGYMELHIGIGDDQREYWKRAATICIRSPLRNRAGEMNRGILRTGRRPSSTAPRGVP